MDEEDVKLVPWTAEERDQKLAVISEDVNEKAVEDDDDDEDD